MLLSVCTIVKNERKHITEFMESVLAYADEVVIVDNGSTDGTLEELKRFPVKVFRSEESFDIARNVYLEQAKGDWILTLDTDERLEIGCVDTLKKALESMDESVNGVILPLFNYFGGGFWCQWALTRVLRNRRQHLETPIHASFNESALQHGGKLRFVYAPIHHYDALWNTDLTEKRRRNSALIAENISKDVSLYKNLADEHYAAGEFEKAIELGKLGLIMDTKPNSRINKGLANYLYDQGRYQDSIYYAEQQIRKFAPQIQNEDGRSERYKCETEACKVIQYKCYYAMGEVEKALAMCEENILQFPMFPHNYLNRYIMSGKKNKSDLEMARLLNPELQRNLMIYQEEAKGSLYSFASSVIKESYM